MKYMGSKSRIAKHILPIMLEAARKNGHTTWVEPFVGGGNMIDKVPDSLTRIGYDVNPHTIAALIAVRDYVDVLPENVTKEDYEALKGGAADPVSSWIRFVCSFGGKFDSGYARQGNNFRYRSTPCEEGKRNALKQSLGLQGVILRQSNYNGVLATNSLVYCDPPYSGTTSYKAGAVPKFDHTHFFQWCRDMKTQGNTVFVSEYAAPEDFTCVWQGEVKTCFSSTRTKATHNAVEKLFIV